MMAVDLVHPHCVAGVRKRHAQRGFGKPIAREHGRAPQPEWFHPILEVAAQIGTDGLSGVE